MTGTVTPLALCNTLTLQANTVYVLNSPCGYCDISNVNYGTGSNNGDIYLRYDGQDAAVNDPGCLWVPPGGQVSGVNFSGPISIIADKTTIVTVRCY